MRYITPLFLIALCAATNIHCMDKQKNELDLRRQFATTCWLKNADPEMVKLIGADELYPSQIHTAQLIQAFSTMLDAPCFEFTSKDCTIPVVCP